jgi:hypothetical protein
MRATYTAFRVYATATANARPLMAAPLPNQTEVKRRSGVRFACR